MSQTDVNVIGMKVKDLSKAKGNHGILHNYRLQTDVFKNKKLSRHFVKVLLETLEIPQNHIDNCLKAPLAIYSKILDITHKIVNGQADFSKLGDLKGLMCDDLKVIPSRLKDPVIFNAVKNYLNEHIEFRTR